MQIYPIFAQKINHNPAFGKYSLQVKPQSFTSAVPFQEDLVSFSDNIELNPQTSLFRNDLDWDFLIQTINTRFPQGTQIHCFACSDGSEPYSVALRLKTKLGKHESKKYFPIQAYDINKKLISKNNEGKIQLFDSNSFYADETFAQKDELKYFKKNNKIPSKKIPYDSAIPYLVSISQYNVKSKLRDRVDFKVGDICDFARIPQQKPCVVMFRNAWYLLKDKETENNLIKNLSKNLVSGSVLVIGESEEKRYKDERLHKKLYENGFSLLDKENKNIFIKRFDEEKECVAKEYDENIFRHKYDYKMLDDEDY